MASLGETLASMPPDEVAAIVHIGMALPLVDIVGVRGAEILEDRFSTMRVLAASERLSQGITSADSPSFDITEPRNP